MPLIWRTMKMEHGVPAIGRGASLLGVRIGSRPEDDIAPDNEGFVGPGAGGMSVVPSVGALPPHRLPRRLRQIFPDRFPEASGSNALHCWSMGEGPFEDWL
jgi:hypothetical protein